MNAASRLSTYALLQARALALAGNPCLWCDARARMKDPALSTLHPTTGMPSHMAPAEHRFNGSSQ